LSNEARYDVTIKLASLIRQVAIDCGVEWDSQNDQWASEQASELVDGIIAAMKQEARADAEERGEAPPMLGQRSYRSREDGHGGRRSAG
jgi:hypothetical protein